VTSGRDPAFAASPSSPCGLQSGVGRSPFVDPTKEGIFRDHSCWKCRDGELPCTGRSDGDYGRCEYPHARND